MHTSPQALLRQHHAVRCFCCVQSTTAVRVLGCVPSLHVICLPASNSHKALSSISVARFRLPAQMTAVSARRPRRTGTLPKTTLSIATICAGYLPSSLLAALVARAAQALSTALPGQQPECLSPDLLGVLAAASIAELLASRVAGDGWVAQTDGGCVWGVATEAVAHALVTAPDRRFADLLGGVLKQMRCAAFLTGLCQC